MIWQAGFRVGDGGFDVDAAGDTNLKGGVITNTQAAIDSHRNAFSTGGTLAVTDIENRTRYEAVMTQRNLLTSSR